jgi:hypothetical protein
MQQRGCVLRLHYSLSQDFFCQRLHYMIACIDDVYVRWNQHSDRTNAVPTVYTQSLAPEQGDCLYTFCFRLLVQ